MIMSGAHVPLAQWGAGPHTGFLRAMIMEAVLISPRGTGG